jgi:hypothetical protein
MSLDAVIQVAFNVASIFITAFVIHLRTSKALENRLTRLETTMKHVEDELKKLPCLMPEYCIRRGEE